MKEGDDIASLRVGEERTHVLSFLRNSSYIAKENDNKRKLFSCDCFIDHRKNRSECMCVSNV